MFRRKQIRKPEWDADFEPLMKVLLSKRGVKTRVASEIGRRKVNYLRGIDFRRFLLRNGDLLKQKCPEALSKTLDDEVPGTDEDVDMLGIELIRTGFMYKAVDADGSPRRRPALLGRAADQAFEGEGFYVVAYERPGDLQHLLLALLIAAVLLVVMFPIWPVGAKIGTWFLSFVFFSSYFGVLTFRMAVYLMFWIAGVDFWILPNITDEYCGFLASFWPLCSSKKRKDGARMLLARSSVLALAALVGERVSRTASLNDARDLVRSSYIDVLDWGVEKLTALPASERQMLPAVEELEEDNFTTSVDGGGHGFASKTAEAKPAPGVGT